MNPIKKTTSTNKRYGDALPSARPGRILLGNCRGNASIYILFCIFIIAAGVAFYLRLQEEPQLRARAANKQLTAGAKEAAPAPVAPVDVNITITGPSNGQQGPALVVVAKAINSGKFDEAAELLRLAAAENPDSVEIKEVYAKVLNRNAVQRLNEGRFTEAKDLLIEAARVSNNAIIVKNLAQTQVKLEDFKGAASTLEPLVANEPLVKKQLVDLYMRIVNDANRNGRVDVAAQYYEKLLVIMPEDAGARKALAALKSESESEGRMHKTDGSHFTVKYDGGENAVAAHVIGLLLEEAYHKVGSDMNFYPDDRIEALLYFNERFRDITGSPSWAGALFDGRIKVPSGGVTEKSKLLEDVLFHEYTHAVIYRLSGGRAPIWIHEGLAQIEEGKDDADYAGQLKNLADSLREKHFEGNVLRGLEGSFMRLSPNEAASAYLLSLSATKYLVREFGIFSARRILENLKEGKSMDDAVYGALTMSYDDFQNSWLDSLRNH